MNSTVHPAYRAVDRLLPHFREGNSIEGGMGTSILSAVIAGFVAVSIWVLTTFVGENYRRFRDGAALAAGLAGELESYKKAWPNLDAALETIVAEIEKGGRKGLSLRDMGETPKDAVFDASAGSLGVLGPALAHDAALVYGQIRGFRSGLLVVMRHHAAMEDAELLRRSKACHELLTSAAEHCEQLLPKLTARAHQRFYPRSGALW